MYQIRSVRPRAGVDRVYLLVTGCSLDDQRRQPCYWRPAAGKYQVFGRTGVVANSVIDGVVQAGADHPPMQTGDGGTILMDIFVVKEIISASVEEAARKWPDCELSQIAA